MNAEENKQKNIVFTQIHFICSCIYTKQENPINLHLGMIDVQGHAHTIQTGEILETHNPAISAISSLSNANIGV